IHGAVRRELVRRRRRRAWAETDRGERRDRQHGGCRAEHGFAEDGHRSRLRLAACRATYGCAAPPATGPPRRWADALRDAARSAKTVLKTGLKTGRRHGGDQRDTRTTGRNIMAGTVEKKLAELEIVLPTPASPIANYIPYVRAGSLLFVSGQ